jgi:hypothetical protein
VQARLVPPFYLHATVAALVPLLHMGAHGYKWRVTAEFSLLQFSAGVALERGWQFIGGSIMK